MGWKDQSELVSGTGSVVDAQPKKMTDDEVTNIIAEYNLPAQVIRQIGQGVSFGYGDEFEAGVRSLFSKRDYKDIRDELRTKQQLFESEYPIGSTVAELTGSIALPFGAAKTALGGTGIAQKVAQGLKSQKAGTRIGTGAAVGGAGGAMYGAGTAEEISDIPKDAATMGAVGAVGGAVIPEIVGGVKNITGSLFRNISERVGLGNANQNATRILAKRLKDENLTTQDVKDIFAEYKAMGVNNATLADLGETLKDLGYISYQVPSKSKTATREFLEGRGEDIKFETFRNLSQGAGIDPKKLGVDYLDDLIQANKKRATDAYKGIEDQVISAKPFKQYKGRDILKDSYKKARDIADVEGKEIIPFEKLFDGDTVSLRTMQQIKQGLDEVLASPKATSNFKLTPYGGAVSKLRKEIDTLIKSQSKAYKKADETFATDKQIKDAYEQGIKYDKLDAREMRKQFLNATDAEKESFRVGMMSNIEKKLGNLGTNDLSTKIFKSPAQKAGLRYIFKDQKAFDKFVNSVEKQKNILDTNYQVLGGSQTGKRNIIKEEAEQTAKALDFGINAASGQFIASGVNALKSLVSQAKISPETAEALKKKLYNSGNVESVLKEIDELIQKESLKKAPKGSYYGGVVPSLLFTEEEMPTIEIVGGQYSR